MTRVAVLGVGAFSPQFPDAPSWQRGEPSPEMHDPAGAFIEKRSRRRVSVLTKALADAYAEAIAQSGVDASTVPTVFGSALGEASTMISLLDQMWREGEGLSPMKFAMSVHNAASGVVSISGANHAFTTSLGADFDTPAMALMEAIGLVATQSEPVVIVCGDDAVPIDIVSAEDGWTLLAGAVVLAPAAAFPDAPTLELSRSAHDLKVAPMDGPMSRNPNAGMFDLVHALGQKKSGVVRLDRGAGLGWSASLMFP